MNDPKAQAAYFPQQPPGEEMIIDPNKIETAKEWAGDVLRGVAAPYRNVAAEVIAALPKTIVDGDKLREVIERWGSEPLTSETAPTMVEQLRDLLPAPKPPTVEIKFGAWAMHPEYGEGIIVSNRANGNGNVQFLYPNEWGDDGTGRAWTPITDLSPLADTDLESLPPAPPKPADPRKTLADMPPAEREACQWMQATVFDEEDQMTGVIHLISERDPNVWIMFKSGRRNDYRPEEVTPLPDLPRLKWPSMEVQA